MAATAPLSFEVLTLFPEIIESFVGSSLLNKAIDAGLVSVHCTNPRDFARDRHRSVDDTPFGGGAGMVIKPEPIVEALESIEAERGPAYKILLTPSGRPFDQACAQDLAKRGRIALLCGRYEGFDERIRTHFVDDAISLGDFVLNGGEVAAAAVIEAVARLAPGVLGNPESIAHESFAVEDCLEHPQYTRPATFRDLEVPAVLQGGDHGAVERWRRREAIALTWRIRPELRPRPRLPEGHPVYVVRTQADQTSPVDGATLCVAGQAFEGRRWRDFGQLRRLIRKKHGVHPSVVVVGAQSAGPEGGAGYAPIPVLDILGTEADPESATFPPIVVLTRSHLSAPWARGIPENALSTLVEDDFSRGGAAIGLAKSRAMIDISPPRSDLPPARDLVATLLNFWFGDPA